MCRQRRVDAVGDHGLLERTEGLVRHEVVGEAHRDGVGAARTARPSARRAGRAALARATRDEVPPTSGMKPMPTSGIAILVVSVTTRHAAVGADPDAAAHHDAVHQRDIRLAEAADLRVQHVLVVPELSRFGPVGAGAVMEHDEVAACAQAAFARTVERRRCGCRRRWSQSASTGDIAFTIAWVSELIALGRLRVIRPTPLSTRY